MIGMNYEQAVALGDLLDRIDDDERGTLTLEKNSISGDLLVKFDDATFEISAGGTTDRLG
jgi:hypothetical protein